MTNSNGMSPADMAAVMGNNNGGPFGGDGAWWIIILLLFGWGRNGNGGFGVGGDCATQADVRAAVDQQTLISKLDQQTYGLADATFALNNTIVNGFSNAELSRCNQQAALMAQLNAMMMADQKCCCDIERGIERGFADTNYNLANQFCETRHQAEKNTRDIIDNQNANSRAILDFLTQDKIATLTAENQNLKFAASQAKQNAYLVNELRPCPVPAYITCNPYAASYGVGYGGNGCGCGCGNGYVA